MTSGPDDSASHESGTQLRRPPRIFLILLALLVLGAAALLTVVLTVGDQTDMEEQPTPEPSSGGDSSLRSPARPIPA